jgi:hypothetical protein
MNLEVFECRKVGIDDARRGEEVARGTNAAVLK